MNKISLTVDDKPNDSFIDCLIKDMKFIFESFHLIEKFRIRKHKVLSLSIKKFFDNFAANVQIRKEDDDKRARHFIKSTIAPAIKQFWKLVGKLALQRVKEQLESKSAITKQRIQQSLLKKAFSYGKRINLALEEGEEDSEVDEQWKNQIKEDEVADAELDDITSSEEESLGSMEDEDLETTLSKRYGIDIKEQQDNPMYLGLQEKFKTDDIKIETTSRSKRQIPIVQENNKKIKCETKKLETPFLLRGNLREYQLYGLKWLYTLHNCNANGILADEMGLGKTIQTISLLAHLACNLNIWGPHLIIVPSSVLYNWDVEFKKFLPSFKVLVYCGSKKVRDKKRQGWNTPLAFNVCITSYSVALVDSSYIQRKSWYYMVLDEAHNIKNVRSRKWQTFLFFNTQRRLLLTGTPLQNDLMELWALLHFLMHDIFESYDEWKKIFSDPLTSAIEKSQAETELKLINTLHEIVRPFILRRLKKDVEKQMPKKYEHVLRCQLTTRQKLLYDEFMEKKKSNDDYFSMMNKLMQLRKVCNHPDLFEPRLIVTPHSSELLNIKYTIPAKCILPRVNCHLKSYNINVSNDKESITNLLSPLKYMNNNLEFKFDKEIRTDLYSSRVNLIKSRFHSIDTKNVQDVNSTYNAVINQSHRNHLKEDKLGIAKSNMWLLTRYSPIDLNHWLRWQSQIKQVETELSRYYCPIIVKPSYCNIVQIVREKINLKLYKVIEHIKLLQTRYKIILSKTILPNYPPNILNAKCNLDYLRSHYYNKSMRYINEKSVFFHDSYMKDKCILPAKFSIQTDCGKLIVLAPLLHKLRLQGSKVILFTQMSRILDIIELFINLHGFTYVRLDGSTKVEERQNIVDAFNNNPRMFIFLSSTRAGGVGINLTSANCVVFYDTDWNPAMDRQAMDRCHRIGQTRDVHIYRLITEFSIEENILRKQLQKRQLDGIVVDKGNFATASNAFSKAGVEAILSTNECCDDLYITRVLGDDDINTDSNGVLMKSQLEVFNKLEDEQDRVIVTKIEEDFEEDQIEEEEYVLTLEGNIKITMNKILEYSLKFLENVYTPETLHQEIQEIRENTLAEETAEEEESAVSAAEWESQCSSVS